MTNLSDILPPSNVVTDSSTDTLTNKTLTSPKVNEDVAVTSTATELNLLDGVTATTAELNILDGVTSTAAELNILDGVTSTTAELNILDGVTSTTAELNILDGVTSTTAELNILDGVTSTAAELNALDGITAVVGELNALDIGSTAVGTAVASKAVILDANKDYTGMRNLTISGELDAATLDISGDVDVDGTLETDNLTIGGAQGSDGQVLTSTGSGVGWESAAAGGTSGMQVLQTVTASGASTVDVGSAALLDTTYDAYIIIGTNITFSADNNHFRARIFQGGTEITSSYQMATSYFTSYGSSIALEYATSGGYIQIARAGVVDASYANSQIEVRVFDPTNTSTVKTVQHIYTGVGSSESDPHTQLSMGTANSGGSLAALTAVRFYPASGTMSGVFRLYGVAKS